MTVPARVLSQRASFWVAAGIVGHTLCTSAAPAITYPLQAAAWQLSQATMTAVFAIYPIVVVAVLISFGDLSDHIGRRATLLLGLGASLAGALVFALASGVGWLFVGRALMGLGVGLSAGPSTAAMVEFSAPDRVRWAGSATTAAQAVGFALALILGGALVQYAPWPMQFSFWVLAGLLAVLLAAAWFLPRPTAKAGSSWRPKWPAIPTALRPIFALAAMAVTTAYTHGVLVLSLGAQVARDLIGSDNALVNGAALALFAVLFGLVGIIARSLPARPAMMAGAVASAAGMALLAAAVTRHGLGYFLGATAVSGVGYSLLFLGGLNALTTVTPPQWRAGMLSALYLCAYLSMGVVALVLGQVATRYGLEQATNLGAGTIALLSLATVMLVALRWRRLSGFRYLT